MKSLPILPSSFVVISDIDLIKHLNVYFHPFIFHGPDVHHGSIILRTIFISMHKESFRWTEKYRKIEGFVKTKKYYTQFLDRMKEEEDEEKR